MPEEHSIARAGHIPNDIGARPSLEETRQRALTRPEGYSRMLQYRRFRWRQGGLLPNDSSLEEQTTTTGHRSSNG